MSHKLAIVSSFLCAGLLGTALALADTAPAPKKVVAGGNDAEIARHAQAMLAEGKKTFRFDTFGSEAFWGDALGLHKAIAGEKNGGVGPSVSEDRPGGGTEGRCGRAARCTEETDRRGTSES